MSDTDAVWNRRNELTDHVAAMRKALDQWQFCSDPVRSDELLAEAGHHAAIVAGLLALRGAGITS